MLSQIFLIISNFVILTTANWIPSGINVPTITENLTFASLNPLMGEFRRQIRTICNQEKGRLECPPSPPSKLHLFSASYGQDFQPKEPCNKVYPPFKNRQVLREACQHRSILREATKFCAKKNSCTMGSNQFRSNLDNCQNVPKYLQFEYSCLPEKKQIQFICADSYVDIQCDSSSEKLLIISALVTSNSTYRSSRCIRYNHRAPKNVICPNNKNVTTEVKINCHRKKRCSVSSPPPELYRPRRCPKLNTILQYVCVNRKLLKSSGPSRSHGKSTKRIKPVEPYEPKIVIDREPDGYNYEDELLSPTKPTERTKKSQKVDPVYYWLRVGLIIAGVLLIFLIIFFVACQLLLRRRNRRKRAKMIRDLARQKVEDDFVKKHLGPPTSWSFPSPVSSTNGDRINMSESWIEPTDRFILYDWPLRKSYHGDNYSSSLTRQKQKPSQKQDQTSIDATLPHFYHM